MAERLEDIAARLVAPGKGILAADESSGTIKKRFDVIGLASTEDSRRDYREMLFRTEYAMRDCISGVILYDDHPPEGQGRHAADRGHQGVPFDSRHQGGHGCVAAGAGAGEVVTEGLDNLRDRLTEYYALGARFAKWRAVIDIGPNIPTENGIHANAHALARYAALCQEANIVPIVEPEVLMDGKVATHDIDTCYAVTDRVLKAVFEQLALANVSLPGAILKPNMIIAGDKSPKQAAPQEVAEKTVKLLKARVPTEIAGIAFLSGGQSEEGDRAPVADERHGQAAVAADVLVWPLSRRRRSRRGAASRQASSPGNALSRIARA